MWIRWEYTSGSKELTTSTLSGVAAGVQVVPRQVQEHEVLGAFFLVGKQPGGDLADGAAVEPVGAGDRLQGGGPVLYFQMDLRGGAAQDLVPDLDVEHVGGRVDVAEKPVQADGVDRAGDLVLVGEDRLDAFTR